MSAVMLVDAGNTRIKWALREPDATLAQGAVPTAEAARLAEAWAPLPAWSRSLASNVAGAAVAEAIRTAASARGASIDFATSQPAQLGVTSRYADPGQLGSDRWIALVAAHAAGAAEQLVVNAGTALTIDVLTREGEFLGGVIVPGPALMRRSLDRGTAGLRLTEGAFHAFPRSTPDAITSGAVQACVGAVERMAAALRATGRSPQRLVLSGGAAAELAPHLPMRPTIRENLVLDGLALLARSP